MFQIIESRQSKVKSFEGVFGKMWQRKDNNVYILYMRFECGFRALLIIYINDVYKCVLYYFVYNSILPL